MQRLRGTINTTGLHLDVLIGVSGLMRKQRYDRGLDIPSAANVSLIVDTGADSTMISSSVMLGLGLVNPTSYTRIFTSTTGAVGEVCEIFDVAITIRNADRSVFFTVDPFPVISRHLPSHSIHGMFGRDLLDQLVLKYDGPKREYTLEC